MYQLVLTRIKLTRHYNYHVHAMITGNYSNVLYNYNHCCADSLGAGPCPSPSPSPGCTTGTMCYCVTPLVSIHHTGTMRTAEEKHKT